MIRYRRPHAAPFGGVRINDYVPPDDGSDTLNYVAHNEKGKAIAKAEVYYSPSEDYTSMYLNDGKRETDLIADAQRAHDTNIRQSQPSWHEGLTRPAKSGEQLVLFGHHYDPPRAEVMGLYAQNNPTSKIAAMTLLGMADMASTAVTGKSLKPSESLSTYSGALVNKLVDSGAISKEDVPHPFEDSYSNGISFSGAQDTLDRAPFDKNYHYQDLDSRIPHARARIREALGKPKRELGPQFTQMQLEGFE